MQKHVEATVNIRMPKIFATGTIGVKTKIMIIIDNNLARYEGKSKVLNIILLFRLY